MSEEEQYSSGLSVTLKAAEGFDAPWIVIHAQTVAEARATLMELHESDLMEGVAAVAAKFQSHFQQKPRYQGGRGGSGSRGGTAAPSAAPSTPTSTAPATTPTAPPPAFVPNQQAQAAAWGTPQAVQQLQQELGAQVMGQVPNEVAYCVDHGNAPRTYNDPFHNPRTNRDVSASYRCQVQGCKPYWLQKDGTWQRQK